MYIFQLAYNTTEGTRPTDILSERFLGAVQRLPASLSQSGDGPLGRWNQQSRDVASAEGQVADAHVPERMEARRVGWRLSESRQWV